VQLLAWWGAVAVRRMWRGRRRGERRGSDALAQADTKEALREWRRSGDSNLPPWFSAHPRGWTFNRSSRRRASPAGEYCLSGSSPTSPQDHCSRSPAGHHQSLRHFRLHRRSVFRRVQMPPGCCRDRESVDQVLPTLQRSAPFAACAPIPRPHHETELRACVCDCARFCTHHQTHSVV
jgi:hypothetical protein